MKGPYDGQNRTYKFGSRGEYGSPSFQVTATSLAKAIRAFRVGAMFSHQYSTEPIFEMIPREADLPVKVAVGSKPGATVHIAVKTSKGFEKIAEIPPEALDLETEFGPALLAAQDHLRLAAAGMGLPEETSTALALAGPATGLQGTRRNELEMKTLALQKQMQELENAKREMANQIAIMKAEMDRRMEQIWMIELFLGSNEEVKRLAEGDPAPAETPITVRQAVLCMDEEIAVFDWFNNPERIGEFDYQDLDDFDRWLTSDPAHLNAIFPHPKGIVGLRVRRNTKERSEFHGYVGIAGAWKKMGEEELDSMTYLLVRNGGNLYRLWVDVQLFPRLFAAEKDFAPPDPEAGWIRGRINQRETEAKMKKFFAGLLVVQGLLERSALFHPLPAANISVFKPEDQHYFNLVRDHEDHLLLTDNSNPLAHLMWPKYRGWLETQLGEGVRVMWLGRTWDSSDDKLVSRTGIRSVAYWPKRSEIYTLQVEPSTNPKQGPRYEFLYLPEDSVYKPDPDYRGCQTSTERQRRVRFRCFSDEVLPMDFMSWRVLEHLLRDRNSRPYYGEFFTTAFHWWKQKRAEAERERPFVDLVLTQAGVDLGNEGERARCERLVRWWKMKVQEHRTLSTDEAKALRMVLQAFKRGEDHENDPERLLFRR